MTEPDAGAQYANDCCDNGWIHLCGGPHDEFTTAPQTNINPATGEEETVEVPVMTNPPLPTGCQTVRCEVHCSCFAPNFEHQPGCALATEEVPSG